MIKKAIYIICALYLYINFVSYENKADFFEKGKTIYHTVIQSLKKKDIHIEANKWPIKDIQPTLSEPVKSVPVNAVKKKRQF